MFFRCMHFFRDTEAACSNHISSLFLYIDFFHDVLRISYSTYDRLWVSNFCPSKSPNAVFLIFTLTVCFPDFTYSAGIRYLYGFHAQGSVSYSPISIRMESETMAPVKFIVRNSPSHSGKSISLSMTTVKRQSQRTHIRHISFRPRSGKRPHSVLLIHAKVSEKI